MATATATVTIDNYPTGIDNTQHLIHVYGTITIQASPATYATGGLALSFVSERIKTRNQVPNDVVIMSDNASLYPYRWNRASNTIQILAASAASAGGAVYEELPNTTAIPASVSGDTIRFHATFARNAST